MSEKTKNVMLGVLIVGLVAMTVAYAALSTTLRISGTASIENDVTWDVHFANWVKSDGTTPAANPLASTVDGQANTGIANDVTVTNGTAVNDIAITLKQPGDRVQYTFDIVNTGTIDAKLSGTPVISITDANDQTTNGTVGSTGVNDGDIIYVVSCDANQGMLAKTNGVTHCTLTVEYDHTIVNQHQNQAGQDQTYELNAKTLTLGASWVYVQN